MINFGDTNPHNSTITDYKTVSQSDYIQIKLVFGNVTMEFFMVFSS